MRHTQITVNNTETPISNERLYQYMSNRYGQREDTQERYAEAVRACSSIDFLSKSISEIAREFGLDPECLRNQLRRHFPEVIPRRDQLRRSLGINVKTSRGVSPSTLAKYAPAIAMLRDTSLTLHEVAEKCNVPFHGLRQHMLFYHKDVAELRLGKRLSAISKPAKPGEMNAAGRIRAPRKESRALYGKAVKLYRTTGRLAVDIAVECGLEPRNLLKYIARWHRDDMELRQRVRSEQADLRRQMFKERRNGSREVKAEQRYSPALPLIEQGATYQEAARQLGIDVGRLSWWVRNHYPEMDGRAKQNAWVMLPDGTRLKRQRWQVYQEAAHAYCVTDEPMKDIAKRLNLPLSTLNRFLQTAYPAAVERRKAMRHKNS